ncbi:NTF2 fold immunity protein [Halpernia sp. GG3]
MKIFILFLLMFISCSKIRKNYSGGMTDKFLAIEIAQKKWNEVYGEEKMSNEQPLEARKLNGSIWYVEGTFNSIGFGGVAFGKVDVKNKKVIEFSHGK